MLLFLVCFFFLSRSESGSPCVRVVHSSNTHCAAVYRPILTRFRPLFSEGIGLSDTLHSSHIRRQVAPQFSLNCGQKLRKSEKSAEKFVRTTSYRQLRDLKKIPLQYFKAENVDVLLCKIFSARRYIALTALSNFVQVVQKRLGMNKILRTKIHTGSKFSETSLALLCT